MKTCSCILSTLYVLVKLVKCLFLFLLPDFIPVNKDFRHLHRFSFWRPGPTGSHSGQEGIFDLLFPFNRCFSGEPNQPDFIYLAALPCQSVPSQVFFHHQRRTSGINGTGVLRAGCPSCHRTVSVKTLKRTQNADSFLHSPPSPFTPAVRRSYQERRLVKQ